MTVLDRRVRPVAIAVAALAVVGAATGGYLRDDQLGDALLAVPAALLAVGVAALALSLPGVRLRGAVLGGCFVAAGMFTWTFTHRPLFIWAVLAVQGLVAAVWAWPWLAGLRALPRLGTAWFGLAYWVLGTAGALLVGHLGVAVQRAAYGGAFGLSALAIVALLRRPRDGREDPSVGIAAAILLGLAALLLAGSVTLFATVHDVPGAGAASLMRNRFWGGPALYFHPNSMAGLAVIAAARIGPDRAFAAWQRLSVLVLAGFLLFESNSRVGFLFAGTAAVVHAVVLLRGRLHPDTPAYRRVWLAALLPFLVIGLALGASGGQKFLTGSRFHDNGSDVTSGRLDTWSQVGRDWLHAGVVDKLLGDTRTSRAVVTRDSDPVNPDGTRPKLNTDNSAVGALRRGGVLGAAAFLFGLLLLLANLGLRRLWAGRGAGARAPAWLLVAALGALPTIATEDWWLGGTNGAIWMLLLAGEAYLLWAAAASPAADSEDAAADPDGAAADPVGEAGTVTPESEPSRR
jgi:hypothetical protein